jgi:hypothetical protein
LICPTRFTKALQVCIVSNDEDPRAVQRAPVQFQLTLPTLKAPCRSARLVVCAVIVTVADFAVLLVFVWAIVEVVSNTLASVRTAPPTQICVFLIFGTMAFLQG